MKRFVQGTDRTQGILLPERLEDYVCEDNPVRVVDVFVDSLDLQSLGFDGAQPALTGRPAVVFQHEDAHHRGQPNRVGTQRRGDAGQCARQASAA